MVSCPIIATRSAAFPAALLHWKRRPVIDQSVVASFGRHVVQKSLVTYAITKLHQEKDKEETLKPTPSGAYTNTAFYASVPLSEPLLIVSNPLTQSTPLNYFH
jgi:hypothetical protein